jgi:hypothetical protein
MAEYIFNGDTRTDDLKGTLSIVTEDISMITNEKNRNFMWGEGLVNGELFKLTMSFNDYDKGAKSYINIDSSELDGKSISDIKLEA